MRHITRFEATQKLQKFIGQDLRKIAQEHSVTVFKNGKMNKGWAGHTLERALGIGNDTTQAPNGETWELKVVPLVKKKKGGWRIKETMAITMIKPSDVKQTSFEKSHLCSKMKRLIICGRERVDKEESESKLLYVNSFDILSSHFWQQIKKDYEKVQQSLIQNISLASTMGKYVQPRTKGAGKNPKKTRAFYARKFFVEMILGMREQGQG